MIIPPWLCPTTSTGRPARSDIVRTAFTTYSAAVGMSPMPWPGSSTVQNGRPSAAKARA